MLRCVLAHHHMRHEFTASRVLTVLTVRKMALKELMANNRLQLTVQKHVTLNLMMCDKNMRGNAVLWGKLAVANWRRMKAQRRIPEYFPNR